MKEQECKEGSTIDLLQRLKAKSSEDQQLDIVGLCDLKDVVLGIVNEGGETCYYGSRTVLDYLQERLGNE